MTKKKQQQYGLCWKKVIHSLSPIQGLGNSAHSYKNWMTLAEVIIQVKNNVMLILVQSPVVQRLDTVNQWINHHPVDKCEQNMLHYPPDSDSFIGRVIHTLNNRARWLLRWNCSDWWSITLYILAFPLYEIMIIMKC